MSAHFMLMFAAAVCYVTGGLLLGLAFAFRYRVRAQAHHVRTERLWTELERTAA